MECSVKIIYKRLKRESDNGNIITKREEGRKSKEEVITCFILEWIWGHLQLNCF